MPGIGQLTGQDMNPIVNEVLPILQALLSGFVATVIFYWLADAKKPTQFERVIQALIFTGVIKLLLVSLEWVCLLIGRWHVLGRWTENVGILWSVLLAVIIGLALAFFSQHDLLYRLARRLRLTSKASIGEWRFAFSRSPGGGVVLHMRDGRRLMGYPDAWPIEPQGGYFLMAFPAWLVGGDVIEAQGIAKLLIANADVQWVEFLEAQTETSDE